MRIMRSMVLAATLAAPAFTLADGPADNIAANVRRIPQLGVEVPADQRKQLEDGLAGLRKAIEAIRTNATKKKDARTLELLPDVEVYHKAVDWALRYQEFFKPQEIKTAFDVLKEGMARAEALAKGEAPWTTQTGLVVRGYISKLDGSVQPCGLVVPASYTDKTAGRYRLDLWFHGRGETQSELNFIEGRRKSAGQFTPADTLVLHPYARYCNGNKLAGEIDSIEALEFVKKHYRVDEDRISVRGFSMGGAATWNIAGHYADQWFAANPGAGFSETPLFLKVFQSEEVKPTWWEQKLYHWYDMPDWAMDFAQLPLIAYSGEIDKQKQAADVMEARFKQLGIEMTHIIGPQTAHKIHPDSAVEIEKRMASLAVKGRVRVPREVHFVTWMLRYNKMFWVTVDGLAEHWAESTVDGYIVNDSAIRLTTKGVTDLSLDFAAGEAPFGLLETVKLQVDGQAIEGGKPKTDRSWSIKLHREGKTWVVGPRQRKAGELAKTHEVCGPVDDALMGPFVFVKPTGKPANDAVGAWAASEFDHAVTHWRQQMRGDARVKKDTEISESDIANSNLVLWGDPSSNAVMAKIMSKLPIQWTPGSVTVGDQKFDGSKHTLIAVYPNPLNPQRYVVLNSSFTYREYAYLNNARQVAKLPDWAVVDVTVKPDALWPGKIVAANFFDEKWQLKPAVAR
jgi:pimeloyl-ACP methyl ester carboxylesterase